MLRVLLIIAIAWTLTWPSTPPAAADQPSRLTTTPDMLQIDPRLPDAGAYYCGPVALSNGLMYLARHGRPSLIPKRAGDPQINMTMMLAGNSYLKTYQNKGTSTPRLMLGTLKYLNRQGFKGSVKFMGWRTIDRSFRRRLGLADKNPPLWPDLNTLKKALARKDTAVVLDIGWYRQRKESHTFVRLSGHWVTLVGLTKSADRDNTPTLILHNPDPVAGKTASHDRVTCKTIERGTLTGKFQGLPVRANGFLQLVGIPTPKAAPIAILDGAVIVQVAKKN